MLFVQIGTPKIVTGTAEGTLLAATDFKGSRQDFNVEEGDVIGGYFSTVGVSGGGVPTNIYRAYIGTEKIFEFQVDQEADALMQCVWRATCVAKSSDTLTFQPDINVRVGEYCPSFAPAPFSVDQSKENGINFLDDYELTVQSSGIGQGAQVRQIMIT